MAKCNQFLKTLNKLDLKMKQMRAQSEEVRLFYDVGLFPDTYDKALDLEETMEQAVLLSRALPAYTGAPYAERAVEDRIQAAVPVNIGFTEERWFTVQIPLLLPKKNRGSAEYIRAILYPAMRDFFMGKEPVRFTDCVLIYRHVYRRDRPERQMRDHDNIEINMVSDIVAMYVMPDDGPQVCSHYYCSAGGMTERTEVYVVPKQEFQKWVEWETTIPDKGVLLNENQA